MQKETTQNELTNIVNQRIEGIFQELATNPMVAKAPTKTKMLHNKRTIGTVIDLLLF
ncbi:hypothetical protein SHI21_13555 [Bacteriovorax sp. PP10]|uniref:Uncharacterized protein n=1 Tax=Bacteriovorax antarcticus TaxID=3088717 RepID=A0ABU5VZ05_9BACT|nr:hypothetical protein [Bacteriovorax sp. PP10]MEA9357245.1 hypothetical protein [Bacteriovorax sp. PP10]